MPRSRRWRRSMAGICSTPCTSGSARRSNCAAAPTARMATPSTASGAASSATGATATATRRHLWPADPSSTTASAPCRPASTSMATRTRTAPSTMPGSTAAFGHGEVDVQHNLLGRQFKGGTDSFDAGAVGGYWTRFWENNAYLDGVAQGTWYDVTAQSLRSTLFGFPDEETSGVGLAASLEGGYPFYLGNGWQIEPQAQLIYQAVNIDDFNDGAADVQLRQSRFADRPHRRQGGADLGGRGGGSRQAGAAGDGLGQRRPLARVPRPTRRRRSRRRPASSPSPPILTRTG